MRKTNDGGHVIPTVIGTNEDEMAALEQLGPLTRRAIYESPVRYCASGILKQIEGAEEAERKKYPEHMRHMVRFDPKNPQLDQHLAHGLIIESAKTLRKDRDEVDAILGIKPIVPKRNTVTDLRIVRAERVSARRFRRFCR